MLQKNFTGSVLLKTGKSIWFFMNVTKIFSPDARFLLLLCKRLIEKLSIVDGELPRIYVGLRHAVLSRWVAWLKSLFETHTHYMMQTHTQTDTQLIQIQIFNYVEDENVVWYTTLLQSCA